MESWLATCECKGVRARCDITKGQFPQLCLLPCTLRRGPCSRRSKALWTFNGNPFAVWRKCSAPAWRLWMSVPHGDVGVVANHLLRQHLHMDVGVVELLAHLPQLPHGVVQVAFALAPAGPRRRGNGHIITSSHNHIPHSSSSYSCLPQTCSAGWLRWLTPPGRRRWAAAPWGSWSAGTRAGCRARWRSHAHGGRAPTVLRDSDVEGGEFLQFLFLETFWWISTTIPFYSSEAVTQL